MELETILYLFAAVAIVIIGLLVWQIILIYRDYHWMRAFYINKVKEVTKNKDKK